MTQPNVAIAYHSGFGHTKKQAEAVLEGVRAAGATGTLFEVDGNFTDWEALEKADAIIFGAPTYMGSASAQFKAFMDATSRTVFAAGFKWKDKIAAGFTNSASRSGDKLSTLLQMVILSAQHGMHWVNLGLPPGNNSSTGSEADLNRLGFYVGAGAQSNADQGADVVPPEADLKTAAHLGSRVATVTRQFIAGRDNL